MKRTTLRLDQYLEIPAEYTRPKLANMGASIGSVEEIPELRTP